MTLLIISFKTDFDDQKELHCTRLLLKEEEWCQCVCVGSEITSQNFRDSTCIAPSCCPPDAKSLILKIRYLLVLELYSRANQQGWNKIWPVRLHGHEITCIYLW